MIGYLPQQLISESLFNHVHKSDQAMLHKTFQDAIANPKLKIRSGEYRFRHGSSPSNEIYAVTLETVFAALQNPFSGQIEYVVAHNRLISDLDTNAAAATVATQPLQHHTSHASPAHPITFTLSSSNLLATSLLSPPPPLPLAPTSASHECQIYATQSNSPYVNTAAPSSQVQQFSYTQQLLSPQPPPALSPHHTCIYGLIPTTGAGYQYAPPSQQAQSAGLVPVEATTTSAYLAPASSHYYDEHKSAASVNNHIPVNFFPPATATSGMATPLNSTNTNNHNNQCKT